MHIISERMQVYQRPELPAQVMQGAATLGWPLQRYLGALRDAGLGSLPGTAAEVLDDAVRAQICPDKLSTAQWLQVLLPLMPPGCTLLLCRRRA